MGLDIQIGALGAEYDHFKKRLGFAVFFFTDCNSTHWIKEIRLWMH